MAANQTHDFDYPLRTNANSHFSHNFIHLEVLVAECFLQAGKGFFADDQSDDRQAYRPIIHALVEDSRYRASGEFRSRVEVSGELGFFLNG